MAAEELYTCSAGGLDDIPEEVRNSDKYSFPGVHQNPELMSALALALKEHENDIFASVPFCLTVEAEALGGLINLGNNRTGPRVREYAYKDIKELLDIDYESALNSGERIKTVMESIKQLSAECPVIFNINGVFTTLVSLIDINTLYKAMRSDPETVSAVFEKLREFIVRFTELGLENGASVISYADPVGDVTIMGAKSFSKFAAPITCDIIKDLIKLLGDRQILHLCGRMTNGLNKVGLLNVERMEMDDIKSYGDGLWKLIDAGEIKFIGNYCIKKTYTKNTAVFPLAFLEVLAD